MKTRIVNSNCGTLPYNPQVLILVGKSIRLYSLKMSRASGY